MLHLVFNSSYKTATTLELIDFVIPNDEIIFIEDGVYNILNDCLLDKLLAKTKSIYYLENDVVARGLMIKIKESALVNYLDLVRFTENNSQIISW